MQKQTSKVGQKAGEGHVYQGRFKSFAVETNASVLTVCRAVKRNPVRAGFFARADQWWWSSTGQCGCERDVVSMNDWLIARPADWLHRMNQSDLQEQIAAEYSQEPTVWGSVLDRADDLTVVLRRAMPRIGVVS